MSIANSWSIHYGIDRDPIREIILYPLLRERVKPRRGGTLLDLGCGNGGLLHRLLDRGFDRGIGVDLDNGFLGQARQLLATHAEVSLLQCDLTQPLPLESESADVITSVFVLNELETISTVLQEARRVLKQAGEAHFVVTHPFLVVQCQLHELYLGKPHGKLQGELDYKSNHRLGYTYTISGATSVYHHHSFEEYMREVLNAGLTLSELLELRTDAPEFEQHPKYWPERAIPKYLYLRLNRR